MSDAFPPRLIMYSHESAEPKNLAIALGHRQVLRLGCSRLIINEPTLMKGMQETTMESMLEKEAAPTAAAIRLPIERPTGIVWAVVLIILGSLLGLFVRLTALPLTTESVPWIALHGASIVVAWGLWHLKRWAYWCLLGRFSSRVKRLPHPGIRHYGRRINGHSCPGALTDVRSILGCFFLLPRLIIQ